MMLSRAAWSAFCITLLFPAAAAAQASASKTEMAKKSAAPVSATVAPDNGTSLKAGTPKEGSIQVKQPVPTSPNTEREPAAASSGENMRTPFDARVQREADERVRKSEGELGYLGAAYAAVFFILGIFLWSTRRGQQRLTEEIEELRVRLDQAHGEASRSDS